MSPFSTPRTITVSVAWLLLPALLIQASLAAYYWQPQLHYDAVHTYLPLARAFMASGPDFLLQLESTRAFPMTYIWPALFAGAPDVLRAGNIGASLVTTGLFFLIGRQIGTPLTGTFAAWIHALSPLILPYVPTALSEPPFLLFTALWLLGLARLFSHQRYAGMLIIAGLGLSILTRPLWLYWTLLAIPCFWFLARRPQVAHRASELRRASAYHLGALLLPGLFLLKNLWLFGLPALATGAGAQLYYGNHPLTRGIDPPLLMLNFDHLRQGQFALETETDSGRKKWVVVDPRAADPRSIPTDRILTQWGSQLVKQRDFLENAEFFLRKAGYALFFTAYDFPPDFLNLRSYRVCELLLAMLGVLACFRQPIVVLLASGLVFQLLQLSVALYSPRYSIGTLEPLLILLAAAGMTSIVQQRQATGDSIILSWRTSLSRRMIVVLSLAAAILAGYWELNFSLPPSPSTDGLPLSVALDLSAIAPPVTTGDQVSAVIPVQGVAPRRLNSIWEIELSIKHSPSRRCRNIELSFDTPAPQFVGYRPGKHLMPVLDDGLRHIYRVSASPDFWGSFNASPLFPAGDGSLRLTADCGRNTQVEIHRLRFIESLLPDTLSGSQ